MTFTVEQIAAFIQGEVIGNKGQEIEGLTPADQPKPNHLTFLLNPKHLPDLEKSDIGCIVVSPKAKQTSKTVIVHKNPKLAFALIMNQFRPPKKYPGKISEQAVISKTAQIGSGTFIDAFVVIGENVVIGKNSVIRANTVIEEKVTIGDNTLLHPNVTIYSHTKVGNRVIIHSGTVIGSDGFGYVEDGEKRVKVPQVGNVLIEDDVEIGANVAIDRSTLGTTYIRQGVKIDNLVQVAHNCDIGAHTVLCAQVGIAGTSSVGKSSILAGQVGVADHCALGERVLIGAQAGIPPKKKMPNDTQWAGTPARPWKETIKSHAAMSRLPELVQEIKQLRSKISELEELLTSHKK